MKDERCDRQNDPPKYPVLVPRNYKYYKFHSKMKTAFQLTQKIIWGTACDLMVRVAGLYLADYTV